MQIQNQGGTIDKFIGDAVMAFWGAPAPNPDHAVDCCRAALACQRAVEEAGLVDDHGQPIKIRIGINSGDMLVGNIGSEVRLNYTVIGDAVNIASRLESTNKVYGSTIIIGPETRRWPATTSSCANSTGSRSMAAPAACRSTNCWRMAGEFDGARDWVSVLRSRSRGVACGRFHRRDRFVREGDGTSPGRCRVVADDRALQAPDRESNR